MIDFNIDCQTFLRLTDTKLGPYGLYVVETSGVRAGRMEQDLDDFAKSMGSYEEDATRLDFIRDAHLLFPTTAIRLLEWNKENNDFELPEWFPQVVTANSTSNAVVLLDQIASEVQVSQEDAMNRLEDLRNTKAKGGVWYPVKLESERFSEILQVLEYIKRSLTATSETRDQTTSSPRIRRSDSLAAEMARALEVLGEDTTPTKVLDWLKQQAGKRGSCITGTARDGVEWKRATGETETTDLRAIRDRLSRIKKGAQSR